MRNAVICTSRGVNLASALGSTGMRGAVIEKTLKNETNVGFARREWFTCQCEETVMDCASYQQNCVLTYQQKLKQKQNWC